MVSIGTERDLSLMQLHVQAGSLRMAGICARRPADVIAALKVPVCLVALSVVIAGCAKTEQSPSSQSWATSTSLFPPSKVEVPASPRVAAGHDIRRGGGIYKIGNPYKVAGKWYVPRHDPHYDATGTASWYGDEFHGRKTANGEVFDKFALTAAHPTLPLPSYVYVTNLENGRTVLVRINDRGPYTGGRIIDLSHTAASHLDFHEKGVARVRVRYAGRAPLNGDDSRERLFLASQPWARGSARYANSIGGNLTTGTVAQR